MSADPAPICNRPTVGIVFGAGGVLGCAHLGVYSVLKEEGIPVDLVVGASIGAMFGLGIAAGLPVEYLTRLVRESTPFDLFRFYAGRLRPSRSNPIARMVLDAGDGKTFADLEMPFAVMGTDMTTGKPCVIDSGPVLPAVQASIALPLIARPVAVNGSYYMDGGLMDTAPVGVARAMGADRVIAVCLGFNYAPPKFVRKRTWTRPLFERLGTQRRPVTGHFRDQLRFGCRFYAASFTPPIPAQDADVAIWPDFDGLSANSISGAPFCYECGVNAARDALPALRGMSAVGDGFELMP